MNIGSTKSISHLAGTLIGVIVTVAVFIILGSVKIYESPEKRSDLSIEIKNSYLRNNTLSGTMPPLKTLESAGHIISFPASDLRTQTAGSINAQNIQNKQITENKFYSQLPDFSSAAASALITKLPPAFAVRQDASTRIAALREDGQSQYSAERIEAAIQSGIAWLAINQNPDGSWGSYQPAKPAFTGLALLAILGHGTNTSPQSINALEKGFKQISSIAKSGSFTGSNDIFTTPILVTATAEAYLMTGNKKLEDPLNKMTSYIISKMNPNGTFSPNYTPGPKITPDIFFTAWNCDALANAYIANPEIPGLYEAIQKAFTGTKTLFNRKTESFGLHSSAPGDFSLNCAGIFAYAILGYPDEKDISTTFLTMKRLNADVLDACTWKPNKLILDRNEHAFTYAMQTWYFQTYALAISAKGHGNVFRKWYEAMTNAFLMEQEKDGSWQTPAQKYGAALDHNKIKAEWNKEPQFANPKDIKIYATSLAILSLEASYRTMPPLMKIKKSNIPEDPLMKQLKIE